RLLTTAGLDASWPGEHDVWKNRVRVTVRRWGRCLRWLTTVGSVRGRSSFGSPAALVYRDGQLRSSSFQFTVPRVECQVEPLAISALWLEW
ncbi:hypothetical protein, partial [Propionibacterium freudenreichii]|uniref:hypothetical protein n=1 Tax=Propionibacterium freudenreichii TaxID=1744 RepID=UPI00254B3DE3